MGKPFVNFHNHSYFSLLGAVSSPKNIILKAKELGCKAVALTDAGNGHGLVEFQEAAVKEDMKAILGVEIALSFDSRFEKRPGIDGQEGHIVLIAKNKEGYKNLVTLMSKASLEGLYNQARIDIDLLEEHKEGLFCLTGSVAGVVGKSLEDMGEEKTLELLKTLENLFGKNLLFEFLKIQINSLADEPP